MTSRLRRMLLVNTRTSGSETSRSINELDPRDGASITGDNAVGKTTTLELLPLFFGALPSQISEAAGGREPMLKFVLPNPYSAIVFEYQVGKDEQHDVRCAILRRADNDHTPEFRLVKAGFIDAAFMREDEAGQTIFCNDMQVVDAYREMGHTTTRVLQISEYRTVILGLAANTQKAVELRRMSTEYGFGSRLTNLDRLISAVAKEKLDFKDFVRLAVTIVEERLNARGDGPNPHRMTLRQSRDHIERWLRDRSALAAAYDMAKEVDLLKDAIEAHLLSETRLRTAQRRIPGLLTHRRSLHGATIRSVNEADGRLQEHEKQAKLNLQALGEEATIAADRATAARFLVTNELARRAQLELGRVAGWAAELERIPQLQVDLQSMESQAADLAGKSQSIEQEFGRLIQEAINAAQATASAIRNTKEAAREQADTQASERRTQAEVRTEEIDAEFTAIDGELSPLIEEHVGKQANLEARIATAQASEASQKALGDARKAHRSAVADLLAATKQATEAKDARREADRVFSTAESELERARDRLGECKNLVDLAEKSLVPPEGSLLAVLRQSDPATWRSGLARVLDPQLLSRTDLQPALTNDDATVLGWRLDTAVIADPSWADDQQARDALEQAKQNVRAAQVRMEGAQSALAQAAGDREKKLEAFNTAEARRGIAEERESKTRLAEEAAQAACEREIQDLRTRGAADLRTLVGETRALRQQLVDAKKRRDEARLEQTNALKKDLKAIEEHKAKSLVAIEERARQAEATGQEQTREFAKARDERLRSEGVDPVKLSAFRDRASEIRQEIDDISRRAPMVNLWREWLAEGGDRILESLRESARVSDDTSRRAGVALSKARDEAKRVGDALGAELERVRKKEAQLRADVDFLEALLREHNLVEGGGDALVDPESSVQDLRDDLLRASADRDAADAKVRRLYTPVRDQLTGRPSSVADYVQRAMDGLPADASVILRASELCTLYKTLDRQVLPNVINDVTTILQQVRQFSEGITRFEREVKNFNREMQRGLNVSLFQRIDDLKVEVLCDFDDLDMMREIKEIDRVAKEHETNVVVHDRSQLPDEATARALTKYLYLLRQDSTLELDRAAHVHLMGSVTVNGETRSFRRPADLENISSTGINAIILITLLVGMVNMVRGKADIYIPWISDEVGKFDAANFKALMETLRANKIDPVTASPKLTAAEYRHFARRYLFRDRGSIGLFMPMASAAAREPKSAHQGATHEA